MSFHYRHLNWFPNLQLKDKEALQNFKGLLEDGERAKHAENLRVSLFYKDLSNETNFSLINLVVQYL